MLLVFIPRALLASEPQIAIITRAGLPAPFAGVLLTNEEYARLIASNEIAIEREKNKHALDKALDLNAFKLTTSTLSIALNELKKTSDDMISRRDSDIKEKDELIRKLSDGSDISDWQKLLWMGVGAFLVVSSAYTLKLINE